jgi:DNA-binding NarL/FixJ family response regulator
VDSEISAELRKLANLLALAQLEGRNKGDQVRLLIAAGFSNDEIARLVGITEGSVRAHASQGKKRSAAEE